MKIGLDLSLPSGFGGSKTTVYSLLAQTAASVDGVSTEDWVNPENSLVDDASTAQSTIGGLNGTSTDYLQVTNLDFLPISSLSFETPVRGLTVKIQRARSSQDEAMDFDVKLLQNGTRVGDNKADGETWSTLEEEVEYNWTESELNAIGIFTIDDLGSDFGLSVQAAVDVLNMSATVASIDFIGFDLLLGEAPSNAIDNILNIFGYYDAKRYRNIVTYDGQVSVWRDKSPYHNDLSQVTSLDQPDHSAANDLIAFDGTDNNMDTTYGSLPSPTIQNLPDAQGGDVGEGFTCTGLEYDPDENCIWAGNDGRDIQGDVTREPSIVKLSADGSTVLDEFSINSTHSVEGCQGVTRDTTNGTLWFADPQSDEVYELNKSTGADTGNSFSVSGSVGFGLAYNAANDSFFLAVDGDIKEYSKNGTLLRTITLSISNIDHIHFDGVYLWITSGANDSPGIVQKVHVATETVIGSFTLADADAIEGIGFNGTDMLIFSDGYFHGTTSAKNRLLTYDIDGVALFNPPNVSVLHIFFAGNVDSASSADQIIGWGANLNQPGAGLYVADASTWRVFVNTAAATSQRVSVDYSADITIPKLHHIIIDLDNDTLNWYDSNTQVVTDADISTASGASIDLATLTVGELESNTRQSDCNIRQMIFAYGDLTQSEINKIKSKMLTDSGI